jgi:RNA-binding protein
VNDELTGAQRRHLRGLAHHLDTTVQLGQRGLTPGVIAEADRALDTHQLIKVRLVGSHQEKDQQVAALAADLSATVISRVGHVVVLYRPDDDPDTPSLFADEGRF